ncbi:discoidin domain-containing protein [Streptomyces sp. NPDC058155]|uniref:discoidin domain-containing protein n=1 Tax=Streptomyces sp. NPDC058155 TaxID=3346359 RepID=UPI0036F13516
MRQSAPDLGSALPVRRVVLSLPPNPAWANRSQTLSVLGSTNATSFTTLSAPASHVFDPSSGNTVTVTFASAASVRYVRVQITGNTGWPAGQLSGLSVYAD